MSLKYGFYLPQGFAHELAGITNPVEAYETLIRLAQTADQPGYDSVWIADGSFAGKSCITGNSL